MPEEKEHSPIIVRRADGSYMAISQVSVHVDYVNEDGSPLLNSEGVADTGNYAISIGPDMLACLPLETVQGLAQIYDASLADS